MLRDDPTYQILYAASHARNAGRLRITARCHPLHPPCLALTVRAVRRQETRSVWCACVHKAAAARRVFGN